MKKAIIALVILVVILGLWMFLAPEKISAPSADIENSAQETSEEENSETSVEGDIEAELDGLDSTDIEAELEAVDEAIEQL